MFTQLSLTPHVAAVDDSTWPRSELPGCNCVREFASRRDALGGLVRAPWGRLANSVLVISSTQRQPLHIANAAVTCSARFPNMKARLVEPFANVLLYCAWAICRLVFLSTRRGALFNRRGQRCLSITRGRDRGIALIRNDLLAFRCGGMSLEAPEEGFAGGPDAEWESLRRLQCAFRALAPCGVAQNIRSLIDAAGSAGTARRNDAVIALRQPTPACASNVRNEMERA